MKKIGIFGGTFDPVHRAHLAMARGIKRYAQLDEMWLLPCHLPPHREVGRDSKTRLQLVEAALSVDNAGSDELLIDSRELLRQTPSYTVDTLKHIRDELGWDVSISWCMGMDSLINLTSWHQWQEIFEYAHVVVAARPQYPQPMVGGKGGAVAEFIAPRTVHNAIELSQHTNGLLCIAELELMPISATNIREQLAKGIMPEAELSESVCNLIEQLGLYGFQKHKIN